MAESDAPEAASVERREEPAKPAAVSLWHKIFGAPAEQAGKTTDVPAAMHTTHIEKASEAVEESFGSEEVRSLSGADVLAEDYFDEFPRGESPALESDDADTTDRKRGRSRRRRRGGRGRKSGERRGETRRAETGDAAPKDSLESGDDFDDLGLSDADDEFADASATDEQYPPEEDSDGESQEASEMSRSKAAQRTIPSWDEAIGFIVDSNMQNRSQRRPSSRGPSRGRPRGRRKN